jgi:hypothetical protein
MVYVGFVNVLQKLHGLVYEGNQMSPLNVSTFIGDLVFGLPPLFLG